MSARELEMPRENLTLYLFIVQIRERQHVEQVTTEQNLNWTVLNTSYCFCFLYILPSRNSPELQSVIPACKSYTGQPNLAHHVGGINANGTRLFCPRACHGLSLCSRRGVTLRTVIGRWTRIYITWPEVPEKPLFLNQISTNNDLLDPKLQN